MPQARSFVAERGSQGIEIAQVTVGAVIAEQTATTTMEIDLRNPWPVRIEAELVVPLPEGAAVRSFTFSGTAKEPTAELLSKDAALGTYKSIVARMKDPAILEFAGYNLIRSSIFPIEAHGTQKVRLTYEHLLPADGQRVDYVLPRTESIDYRVPWDVSLKIKSKRAISTVFSSSHKIEFRHADRNVVLVHVGKEAMNEPGSLQLSCLQDGGDGVTASLFACPDPKTDGGYFLLLAGLPATKPADEKPVLREVTVVIDRSGSMAGEKLKQVKAAALQVIDGLEEGEAFNIIDYSDYLDSFMAKPVLKTKETAENARHYVRRLVASGGTNIHDALAEALRPAPREGMLPIVLFLTDGVPTVGVRDEATLRAAAVKMNSYKRRIFTFGVGYDVNAPLLTHLAQNSRAASTFVLPNEDIEVKVLAGLPAAFRPVISEPELKVLAKATAASECSISLPAVQPDLFEGDQLVVLGRYQGQAPLKFRLDGRFRGRPRHFEFAFHLDHATVKNGFVPRLWASRKIAALIEEIREAGAGPQPSLVSARPTTDLRMKELVDEIVRLLARIRHPYRVHGVPRQGGCRPDGSQRGPPPGDAELRLAGPGHPGRHGGGKPVDERKRPDEPDLR